MKNTIAAITIGVSTLFAAPAFGSAGHCATQGAHLPPAEQVAFMKSCLSEASSPANVQMVALQQKKAYCDKNVKNKGLAGGEKESYLTSCMNKNDAQVQYAAINRGMVPAKTETAATDYNKTLQESPTATGVAPAAAGVK